jgi:hypothetical protein
VLVDNSQFGEVSEFTSVATNQGISVAGGELTGHVKFPTTYEGAMTWSTSDGWNWLPSSFWEHVPNGSVREVTVVAFGSGFAAYSVSYADVGARADSRFFVSSDGEQWAEATPIPGWEVTNIASSGSLLVATAVDWTNEHGSIWYSNDARTWQQANDPNADPAALLATELIATDSGIAALSAMASGLELWGSSDGESWSQAGALPSSPGSASRYEIRSAVAIGPQGWSIVALHLTDTSSEWYAWHSSDGQNWSLVDAPPHDVSAMAATGDGFVATGREVTGSCCAYSAYEIKGVTWHSLEGVEWNQIHQAGWRARQIESLLVRDDHLVGLGVEWSYPDEIPTGDLWLANSSTFGQ